MALEQKSLMSGGLDLAATKGYTPITASTGGLANDYKRTQSPEKSGPDEVGKLKPLQTAVALALETTRQNGR